MNLYKISYGQLVTIWIFGIFFWLGDILVVLDSYSPSGIALVLILLIPSLLIFYTIGWNKFKKDKK
ncbi:MAG: hypothetical protein GF349_03900 [Candidatus Magasanikbacteria bacterium]|nr:hypothetical protein [Candidatus Magasanikbacteria bacterium]